MDDSKIMQGNITSNCDIQSAIHLQKNPTFHDHTKHIDIKYHFKRKVVEEGRIMLDKIDTNKNIVYSLTKLVMAVNFECCKNYLGLLKV